MHHHSSLVTRALAPFGFALALSTFGPHEAVIGLLVISLAACTAYAATTRAQLAGSAAPSEA